MPVVPHIGAWGMSYGIIHNESHAYCRHHHVHVTQSLNEGISCGKISADTIQWSIIITNSMVLIFNVI